MSDFATAKPYADFIDQFGQRGLFGIPVVPRGKAPAIKDWTRAANLSDVEKAERRRRYANHNIGLLAATTLSTGLHFGFVDVDDERLLTFVKTVLSPITSGKRGRKGETVFCQIEGGVKSAKLRLPGGKAPAVEIFATSGMTVVPPSIHPSGIPYSWIGKSLLEVDLAELPILTKEKAAVIGFVVRSDPAAAILDGGPSVRAHDLMLSLTSSGIANCTDDMDWLAGCLNALFHPDYAGNTRDETLRMLQSAKAKGLGPVRGAARGYDPGAEGPIPLGFTKDGSFGFRDQVRNIIILASPNQLLSHQYLLGLSDSEFWASRFPSDKGLFSAYAAGEALLVACRQKGPFNPQRIRGRGIWREGERIVVNLGQPVSQPSQYHYLCFEPIAFDLNESVFDSGRLLKFVQSFRWRNPQDAMLLFGWLAIAPVCGVLNWRPHCFIYGPPRCGKTTIHTVAARLLSPLVVSTDGGSSEAGIRQTLGPDSLPIIIDEFESDQDGHIRSILRLARSASSAENPVLRGTPEGKAMQFSLRTTFFFCAVNPGRMSPADQSRILLLEMLAHGDDPQLARQVLEDEVFFRECGPALCAHMVALASLLGKTIDKIEPALPSADRRHRQNISTLLAGAFVALNGRIPSDQEAIAWAGEHASAVESHAEDIQRDNSVECLEHLLAHVVADFPLGHWIAIALLNLTTDDNRYYDAERITRTFDIVVRPSGTHEGVLIRNGSPNIEEIFRNTIWEGRGWERALRALDGAFTVKNPVYFSGTGTKGRCIGIPRHFIPDPIETIADGEEY